MSPLDFQRDDHRDLAEAVGDLRVDVAIDRALHLQRRDATRRQILADGGDARGDRLGDDAAARIGLAGELLGVLRAGLQRDSRDIVDELLEVVIAGDEVGLGIHLDDDADAILDDRGDETLGGHAAGLFGGLGEALLRAANRRPPRYRHWSR